MNRIARWNGSNWAPMGSGLDLAGRALALLPQGTLAVGGEFSLAGGAVSARVALYTSTCPATATVSGSGCPSSGGANVLTATTLPWVDATFRATGSGLPSLAIVAATTSLVSIPQGALPLASVFAEGMPGCDVLVSPDIVQVLATTTGTAESSLFLPNVPPLVGVTFWHQMVPFELDTMGAFVAITATNALQLTAGDL